ncbi:hypothetical protein BJ508DRAFT_418476 [Ascobolus immersus RN42]|uniref:Uncharacterized protein n=1 Tax=Ascobolus immersus RN42 TaxID=1160509 RepID=A0A3N4HLQ5_ASCIM|nr:hypothetical protein BJ508DRAFT_418476 [Ascobolus immersus RN42]
MSKRGKLYAVVYRECDYPSMNMNRSRESEGDENITSVMSSGARGTERMSESDDEEDEDDSDDDEENDSDRRSSANRLRPMEKVEMLDVKGRPKEIAFVATDASFRTFLGLRQCIGRVSKDENGILFCEIDRTLWNSVVGDWENIAGCLRDVLSYAV